MMLGIFTLLVMLAVTYAFLNTDLLTAFAMLVNVILSGVVSFNFFEWLAKEMEAYTYGSFIQGYEDGICMVAIFCGTLALLRFITNEIAPTEIVFPNLIQQTGATTCGLTTGYIAAGFLVCVFQTIPWHERFLGYEPVVNPSAQDHIVRRLVPPDRVWLAMMNYVSRAGLSRGDDYVFDKKGTFVLRYQRFRRYADDRPVLTSLNEAPP